MPLPASYEVARGDTLFRIAGKVRHPGVTLHQMVLGLYRTNPDAFLDGNINQLVVGKVLSVPPAEAVSAVEPAQAAEQVRALVARPVVVPAPPPPPAKEPAALKPPPVPTPPKPRPSPAALTPDQAAQRMREGLQFEKSGDLAAAMTAYLAAGESGNGEAQKKLGDIYNSGNALVKRDYETALKWYQKARVQGVDIPKPIVSPGPKH